MRMEGFDWVNKKSNYQSNNKVATSVEVKVNEGELMQPRIRVLTYLTGPILLHYAQKECLVDVGRPWTREEILVAAERGPNKSALALDAIATMNDEVRDKVKEGFAEVVYLDEINHLLGTEEQTHLKISPLTMVPHKSRKYRAILDLSFALKIFGMEIPSVNENTVVTAPQHSMSQMGSVLLRLIELVVRAPLDNGNMLFSKLDIKDGYWRMAVERGRHLSFAYVFPYKKGTKIRLVIPLALLIGWAELRLSFSRPQKLHGTLRQIFSQPKWDRYLHIR